MLAIEKTNLKYEFVFLLLCYFVFTLPLFGQQFTLSNNLLFEEISERNGLPSNSANAFVHDKNGYIWIGTFNGLARYDGYEFKVYQKEKDGLIGNYVMALHEDSQGYIWIGTMFNGLQRFHPETETFTNYSIGGERGISWQYITEIKEDQQGTIWVGTTGGLNAIRSEDGSFDPETIIVESFFPFAYPDTLLHYVSGRIISNNVLAKITNVGNRVNRNQNFQLDQPTTVLISSMGEYGGQQKMVDYGWITNEKKEVVWEMDYQTSYPAKSVEPKEDHVNNRQTLVMKNLPAGKYTLHYKSNEQHAYDNWNLPKSLVPYDNDEAIVPAFSDLWGIAVLDCNEMEQKQCQSWLDVAANTSVVSGNVITAIATIGENEIWVGSNGGLDLIKFQENEYLVESLKSSGGKKASCTIDFVNHIFEKSEEDVKIYGGRLNPEKRHYNVAIDQCHPAHKDFQTMYTDDIQVNHGQLFEDAFGELWLTSYTKGLYKLESDTQKPYGYSLKIFPLDNRYAWKTFKDRTGALWIGLWKVGIYKMNPTVSQFNFQKLPVKENTFVTSFAKADDGTIYIGTSKEGLFSWNAKTNELHSVRNLLKEKAFPSEVIQCLKKGPNGNIWIGFRHNGLVRFNPKTKQWKHFYNNKEDGNSLPNDDVHTIHVDRDQTLWVGTLDGLARFETSKDNFANFVNPYVDVSYDNIINIEEDKKGMLWLVSGVRGLFSLDKEKLLEAGNEKAAFREIEESTQMWKVFEDRSGRFWVGDRNGLKEVEPNSGELIKQGVSDVNVNFIQEDQKGNLWLNSNAGIVKYNTQSEDELLFGPESGIYLKGDQYGSGISLEDGRILIGGLKGFYYFDPENISENNAAPQIRIKQIVFPESIIAKDSSLLNIDIAKGLDLKHNQSTMAIEYAGLHYDIGQSKEYAYRLKGLNEEWTSVGDVRTVRLTGLLPGYYDFEVKVLTGKEKQVIKATMPIHVSPPWWRTHLAHALGVLLLAGIVFYFYQFQLRQALIKAEAKRTEELSQLKANFFSNVTHEFRTPLTLIIEPVRQLLRKESRPEEKKHLQLVANNSNRLLELVNRLLDLSKIDENQMEVVLHKESINNLFNNTFSSFELLAKTKNIDLRFNLPDNLDSFYYDAEKVERVLYNLLSNAIKFTPENGKISLDVNLVDGTPVSKGAFLKLAVKDSGPGIDAEDIPKVFDRFFQAKDSGHYASSGTGIGLALSKELATLMKGHLNVESERGEGALFNFWLPIITEWSDTAKVIPLGKVKRSSTDADLDQLDGFVSEEETISEELNRTKVLIVEDNLELRLFIEDYLSKEFEILKAKNGQIGIDLALTEIPDLIISDLMMPVKDGLQLCEELKAHDLSAHIPIILLTAKSTLDNKLVGLSKGADVYLTKPFHLEELEAYVKQLIANRKMLQGRYNNNLSDSELGEAQSFVIEDPFLLKLNEIILAHLDNPSLNVDSLVVKTHLSRSQLYRKVKALTNQSPNEYLRNFRLDQSVDLLRNKEGNVSEVALMVGFNDKKYFSTRFKKRFGYSPSDLLS